MKKFFSLVLALVMVLSLTTVAWGATEHAVADQAAWDSLIAGGTLSDGDTVKLAAGTFNLGEQGSLPANLTIVGVEGTVVTYFGIAFNSVCNVTIKNCDFEVSGLIGFSIAGKGTYVVENCDFTVAAGKNPGSAIYLTALATDNKYTIKNCSFDGEFVEAPIVIQEQDSSSHEVTTFTVNVSKNIFVNGDGAEVGVWHDYADSDLTLNSDAEDVILVHGDAESGGAAAATAEFKAALDFAEAGDTIRLKGDLTLTESVEISTPVTIDTNGKTLTGLTAGAGVTTDASGKLTSGTFAAAPDADDVADGYTVLKNTDGTYVVVPAVGGDKYDLYKADDSLAVKLALGAEDVPALSFTEMGAKANKDGSGNLAYIAASNGEYFVKTTTATVADYAVTVAGKTDVLYYVSVVDLADVQYEATAKAFTNFGTKCGQLYQVDKTLTYYEVVVGSLVSGFLPEDVVVEVDSTKVASYTNVLVGDEIKTVAKKALVAVDTLQADKLLKHKWAVTGVTYSASLGNVPTEAKCLNCGAVVDTFYLGANKVPAGQTGKKLDAPYDKWYIVEPDFASYPSGGVVVTPSTDKTVTSADTFDAGIAMYVGMSVMAAAGSAVVIGKKKD